MWLVVADTGALALGFAGAWALRVALDRASIASTLDIERHLLAAALVGVLVLVWFQLHSLYDLDRILAGAREYARVAQAVTYAVVVVLAVSYFAGDRPLVSRSWLALVALVVPGGLVLERFTVRRVVRALRRRGRLQTRIAIVGASAAAAAIAAHLRDARNEGLIVAGFLDEYLPIGEPVLDGIAVIGRPGDVVHGTVDEEVDEYVLVPQALSHERLEEITAVMIARDRPVLRMAVTPSALLTNGVLVAERSFIPMVTLRRARTTGGEAVLKRAFDVVGAALLLVAVAPVATYELVRARISGVQALFRAQTIHGPDGSHLTFRLLAREVSSRMPVRGMPALVAVLLGRLSLVGPRPVPVHAGTPAPAASALTGMRPGLTGPWRLLGDGATLEEQATQDLAYVRNYTAWEDLRIVVQSARLLSAGPRRRLLGRWEHRPAGEARPVERAWP
jgi:lipopolysaccharide/colanic/teichoic acid biosynthesis glycosyltransferase